MAGGVWFLFFVVFFISMAEVICRDCSHVNNIVNCNECIRCGGFWCNKPSPGSPRCTSERHSSWCPDDRETLRVIQNKTIAGTEISTAYAETNAFVGLKNTIPLTYKSVAEQKVKFNITNTTQNYNIDLKSSTKCSGGNCTVTIEVVPGEQFCSSVGSQTEYVDVKVNVETVTEDIRIKYNIPCACECSEKTEPLSSECNFRGDYSCGICYCHNGWSGDKCETKICENQRGDLQCTNPDRSEVECSGNGYCGPCETCECYTNKTGYQYFDSDNYCADLCLAINSDCDQCLRNPVLGEPCTSCFYSNRNLYFVSCNESSLHSRDEFNREIWVRCNETFDDGTVIEYAAMREESEYFVMLTTACETSAAPSVITSVKVTVPVILGIIGFVAALAAVAGYMVWKNRTPPLPLTDTQYKNIGAEDCTGENPLYKPPTSSFKNPTYGKW